MRRGCAAPLSWNHRLRLPATQTKWAPSIPSAVEERRRFFALWMGCGQVTSGVDGDQGNVIHHNLRHKHPVRAMHADTTLQVVLHCICCP